MQLGSVSVQDVLLHFLTSQAGKNLLNISKKETILLIQEKKINFMASSLSKSLQNLVKTGHLQGNNFLLPSSGVVKQVKMEMEMSQSLSVLLSDRMTLILPIIRSEKLQ